MNPTPRKMSWILTQSAFDHLMAELDPDRAQAGHKYEALRAKLVTFFGAHGASAPEDNADEVLNRLSRRMEEGIEVKNLYAYAASVARHYWKELQRAQARQSSAAVQGAELMMAEPPENAEIRATCFEKCWRSLSEKSRRWMTWYCKGDWRTRIAQRRRMAKELELSPTALRIRVHRIRAWLEQCVITCREKMLDAKD
jgi:DNA-directed RNA polymerase specialized sigma24 family protein